MPGFDTVYGSSACHATYQIVVVIRIIERLLMAHSGRKIRVQWVSTHDPQRSLGSGTSDFRFQAHTEIEWPEIQLGKA